MDAKSTDGSSAGDIRSETVTETAATGATGTPLLQAIRTYEATFRAARDAGDPQAMVAAALDLNDELWAWVADPNQSDELDRGRAALRAMIVEFGSLAGESMRDPAELFGPFVDLLVETRTLAREERRFAEADAVRDQLAGARHRASRHARGIDLGSVRERGAFRPRRTNRGKLITSLAPLIRPPSSSGQGRRPFKAVTRVRIPLGVLNSLVPVGWTSVMRKRPRF